MYCYSLVVLFQFAECTVFCYAFKLLHHEHWLVWMFDCTMRKWFHFFITLFQFLLFCTILKQNVYSLQIGSTFFFFLLLLVSHYPNSLWAGHLSKTDSQGWFQRFPSYRELTAVTFCPVWLRISFSFIQYRLRSCDLHSVCIHGIALRHSLSVLWLYRFFDWLVQNEDLALACKQAPHTQLAVFFITSLHLGACWQANWALQSQGNQVGK